jgi:arylsulfatase
MFRGEKNTNWEGAFRVPCVVRWPGKIPAGMVSNDIMAHQDWFTTLIAAAGDPDINEKLKKGHQAGSKRFKVHIDGHNFLPYITANSNAAPRNTFFYISDEGSIMGLRIGDWKSVFQEQRAKRFDLWREPLVTLRAPKLFNLRRDPFERADENANMYNEWWADRAPYIYLSLATVNQALQTLKEFPQRQKPDSWNLEEIADQLQESTTH